MTEATPPPESLVHEDIAPHLDRDDVPYLRARLREGIWPPGRLDYLAYLDRGVHEFSTDLMVGRSAAPDAAALGGLRAALHNTARQITLMVNELDELLREARTGHLIRLVLHTDSGVLVANSVTVGERHVLGIGYEDFDAAVETELTEWPKARAADEAVSALAERMRGDIGLPTQNAGGWQTTKPPDQAGSAGAAVGEPFAVTVEGECAPELMTACRTTLSPADLVYLAHHRRGQPLFAVDVLEDPQARRIWGRSAAKVRRDFYGGLSRRFDTLSSQFCRLIRPVLSGRLLRIVLDVEQGAVFAYRIGPGERLIGVTLNQSRGRAADEQMARLAAQCTALPR